MRATLDAGCCLLRPWRKEDAAALAHEANNLRVARNLTHLFPHPYLLADARFWIDHSKPSVMREISAAEKSCRIAR